MNNKKFWHDRLNSTAVLSPIDRTSEILFGLIMVLTFTGAISVASDGKDEIRELLWAAIGCNIAWGIVDAIMYLMNIVFERSYNRKVFLNVRNSPSAADATLKLKSEIQPLLSELLTGEELTALEQRIRRLPEPPAGLLLTAKDLYAAFRIFLLVLICTIPVSLPFAFIQDPETALRTSNGIALLMLFLGGYKLAVYSALRPIITATVYMLIGVALVFMTIALGG